MFSFLIFKNVYRQSNTFQNKNRKNRTITRPNSMPLCNTSAVPKINMHNDKFKWLKETVREAIFNKKIFTIYGFYEPLRRALVKRGWIEKLPKNRLKPLPNISQNSQLLQARNGNEYANIMLSKFLQDYHPTFVWQSKPDPINLDEKNAIKNRVPRARSFNFTLKDGLINCAQHISWQTIPGEVELNIPRGYRLFLNDEVKDFMDDFRFTGCTSLLAFIAAHSQQPSDLFAEDGQSTMQCVEFAIERVQQKILTKTHADIDLDDMPNVESAKWREFFSEFHMVTRLNKKFKMISAEDQKEIFKRCRELIKVALKYWPNIAQDGYANIWIMKPGCKSRGIGISVMHDNLRIVDIANRNPRERYIVQKYIGKFIIKNKI